MESRHLSPELLQEGLLPEAGIQGKDIQAAAIQRGHLQPFSVDSEVLSPDSVGADHLKQGSVWSNHLRNEAVQGEHLGSEAVGSRHIGQGAVNVEHLGFTPVEAVSGQPALQQFGMCAFLLLGHESSAELTITFEQPYLNNHYVLVAMTNNPSYYVTLKEQTAESAIVMVTRLSYSPVNYGYVTWIAIGNNL
ncbi:hypothetical protein D3C74_321020 [compost metagenome]